MKLSSRVRYACRAAVDLALHREEGPVSLEALANETSMPEKYLGKIIQDLRRSGLVRSVRGAHGGYMLNSCPALLTVLDVWEALEGPLSPVDCLQNPAGCQQFEECVTRDVWADVQQAVRNVLESVTIAELAQKQRRRSGEPAAAD